MRLLTVVAAILLLFVSDLKAQDNVVKLGVPALLGGRFNLSYERVLDSKKSVQVTFGALIPRKTPGFFTTSDTIANNFDVLSGKWNSMGLTGQMRFYVKDKKEAPAGFYVAPYVGYNRHSMKFDAQYERGDASNANVDFDVTYQNIDFGVLLGTQWIINEKFSIDFNYFGIGLGRNAFKFKYTSDDPDVNYEEIKAEVDEAFVDVPIIGNKIKTTVTDDSVTAKFGMFLPALRMSLSMGYAF